MKPLLAHPVERLPVGTPMEASVSASFDPFLFPFEGAGASWDPRPPGGSPFFVD